MKGEPRAGYASNGSRGGIACSPRRNFRAASL